MKIRHRIALMVFATLAAILAIGAYAIFESRQNARQVGAVTDGVFPTTLASTALLADVRDIQLDIITLVTAPNAGMANELKDKIAARKAPQLAALEKQLASATSDRQKGLVIQAQESLEGYFAAIEDTTRMKLAGETERAEANLFANVVEYQRELSAVLETLRIEKNREKDEAISALNQSLSRVTGALVVATVTALLLLSGFGGLLYRRIIRPLRQMENAIVHTANTLDFRHRIPVQRQDEIGHTLTAYNSLLDRLRHSFADIQQAIRRMQAVTAEANETARQIADNSHVQSEASSAMASAIEELTVSINMVAQQSDEASHRTLASRDHAASGADVILSTVSGIQTISGSVREAAERIDALRSDSDSISAVAGIIRDIADQTNLLALNAAIEAACAGEQGRGFAVVADEVRKLAERTARSTQEISTLLSRMQDSARQAVSSMGTAVNEVESGVENARRAGESIQSIRDGAIAVASAVIEISGATREQRSAGTTIAQQIEQIEQIVQMTELNAAAASTSASAVHQVGEVSDDIARALAVYKV